ncbi:hypothetical protein ASPFODRAFT_50925 [Aspergillus luchuensis CBS 106.47]|uniref:Uncharacterized protein n=1 Tax=Aspergillus luchuensis (strain CBS 106.47) TaxID=1137211 RepID=A0A1M3T5S6_ASPLC|nr:hypothetical protein ASPFODRAFT_50925 [Aspergillus luchuensis CBS 106.47]
MKEKFEQASSIKMGSETIIFFLLKLLEILYGPTITVMSCLCRSGAWFTKANTSNPPTCRDYIFIMN